MIQRKGTSILTTSGLTKYFGNLCAIDNLDIDIKEGEIHSVIGPNGSGKTTFFNLVTGLLQASKGRIYFEGKDITNISPNIITRMGIGRTFQRARVMPMMSCMDNVMAGMYSRSRPDIIRTFFRVPFTRSPQETRLRQRALELLQFVGLQDSAERWGEELVWVECQLLQIAIALATEPRLLLLDEPTAGMGPEETEKVDTLIRQIKDVGTTIVLVAHDTRLVMGISDWVTVLNFGEKITEGRPEEVKDHPKVLEAYLGDE
jgi:branched-chain amino acid transport system ATP-binding protein